MSGKFAACLCAIAVSSAACTRAPQAPSVPDNVLIVTIDTLRADRVGVYGASLVQTPNAQVQTPNIDRLAREGAWAARAEAPAPFTRPSHVSIFTGRSPAEHGIRDNISAPLSSSVPLLADLFSHAGFSTAAFVTSAVLDRQAGLSRGFSLYSDRLGTDASAVRKPGDVAVAEATQWLTGRSRFFAWVHLYDLHAPYEPPPAYTAKYAGRPYDGCVAWADELVGRLVDALRQAGTLDRTLVIVTSDHGESLGEHGEDWHGFFVYESTLRVPLVARGPGVKAGTRIDQTVTLLDLFPTIAESAHLTGVPQTSGRSIAPALAGGAIADAPAFAEAMMPRLHFGWSELRSVRDGAWKYILAPRPELYDLDRDPGELTNVVSAEPARVQALRALLNDRMQREQAAAAPAGGPAMPADLARKLGALGYLSGSAPAANGPLADPKDKIAEYQTSTSLMARGLVALNGGRSADAIDLFRSLERQGLGTFDVHFYLGQAFSSLKRWREAAAEYAQATDRLPAYDAAWRGLGESRAALRDWPAAAKAFEALVAVAPADAFARMQLGDTYGQMGRVDDAVRVFREAVAIDPNPVYWNALGTALGSSAHMPEAERAFAEAVARDANNADYLYNQGIALMKLGRRDDAVQIFRRAAALGYAPARARLAELHDTGR